MIVVWRVTERCNLGCPFCGYDRRLFRPRREADARFIRDFGPVLAGYQRAAGQSVLVSWLGGEPLLWPPLTALTTFFTRQLGLRVSTTTNGTTLASSAVRQHLLEHYSELTVSVDGVGTAHDDLRGWPGGYAALRESVTQMAQEKSAMGQGPLLRANVVLLRQTVSDFERLCLELAEWGIEEITFNQLGGRDRPEFFPAHRLLPENVMRLEEEIPGLRRRLAELGVRLNGSSAYLHRLRTHARDETIAVLDCHPGEQFLFVNEEGMASPCSFTTRGYGVPLVDLAQPGALRDLPWRFAQLRRTRPLPACEDCPSTQVFEKFAV